jgi:hypothetical protein
LHGDGTGAFGCCGFEFMQMLRETVCGISREPLEPRDCSRHTACVF